MWLPGRVVSSAWDASISGFVRSSPLAPSRDVVRTAEGVGVRTDLSGAGSSVRSSSSAGCVRSVDGKNLRIKKPDDVVQANLWRFGYRHTADIRFRRSNDCVVVELLQHAIRLGDVDTSTAADIRRVGLGRVDLDRQHLDREVQAMRTRIRGVVD